MIDADNGDQVGPHPQILHIFEVMKPGSRLVFPDANETGDPRHSPRRDLEALLDLMISCVHDAAISLALFDNARLDLWRYDRSAAWERRKQRDGEIYSALRTALLCEEGLASEDLTNALRDASEAARLQSKRLGWAAGEVPDTYRTSSLYMHARSFVYALDTLQKSLELVVEVDPDEGREQALDGFKLRFPGLKKVRDSCHHAEDRHQLKRFARGRMDDPTRISGRNQTSAIIDASTFFVSHIDGGRFGGTSADGDYAFVDVHVDAASAACDTVQRVIDSFRWTGPAELHP